VIAAFFAMRLLRTMLFEVDPFDPAVIVLAAFRYSCWRLRRL